jgi:hypothetical protein
MTVNRSHACATDPEPRALEQIDGAVEVVRALVVEVLAQPLDGTLHVPIDVRLARSRLEPMGRRAADIA